PCASISCGSRGVLLCGAAIAAAAARKTTRTKVVRILIGFPSISILLGRGGVEKAPAPAYNLLSCLLLVICRDITNFRCSYHFSVEGHRSAVAAKETLNGICDCRALHRHKRHRVRGCLPGGLHPSAQG